MLKPITAFQVIGAPVGKGRPRATRQGAFVRIYTPAKTKDYEAQVADAAKTAMRGRSPVESAVQVNMAIYVEPPKSWTKTKRAGALRGDVYPTTKPDVDNIIKGIFDACNGIVFVDDKQICSLQVTKRYDERPRVEVRAYEVIHGHE